MAGARTARFLDRLPCRAALAAALAFVFGWSCQVSPALAQGAAANLPWVGVPPRSTAPTASALLGQQQKNDPNAQMFVQANEIDYDYRAERVVAAGKVQIHYSGSVLVADRVVYDQKAKKLFAEGSVILTEADGKIISAERLELDENFRNGFIDSLHVETSDKMRIAAARAEVGRDAADGRLTVFQSGVYTACEPCKDDPKKPPKWQVKAARILHDEAEKTVYFEDARIEMFGLPIAYFPYFWAPDPTVKRQTGLLAPIIFSGTYIGYALQVPFFWNLAPNYDVTLTPMPTTKQGPMMIGEWRHRLLNGAYSVRAAGIFQQDKEALAGTTGYRDFRGAIETKGDFRLAQNWWYGWDASVFTDNSFTPQYKVTRQGNEAVSQAYLFGRGNNSYFDARGVHFYGLSPIDVQKQLPVIHPLLDYKYKYADPVFGGELSYNVNLSSLTRQQADYDPITQAAVTSGVCDNTSLLVMKTRANCLLRGIPGTYSRLSADVLWRRSITDSFGQIFTPFLWLRGDVAALSLSPDPSLANFLSPTANSLARATPAVGLDYRYPFISVHSWGTQTIEPRAQFIARPSESQIGRFPNEDSQGLMLTDSNLFAISKFPGYDRVEGGGRANVGLEYTAQFNKAGYVNAMFGQSYQLFGLNSYAIADMANAGTSSGLETPRSDYVGRVTYQPNSVYAFTSRFQFDEQTFASQRLELEGKVAYERWSSSVTYGRYGAQPSVGLLLPREGILPSGTLKLTPNFTVTGSALYSIDSSRLATVSVGLGYIDECFAINAVYTSSYGYRADIVPSNVFMLQVTLRSLGGTSFNYTIGGPGNSNNSTFGF